MFVNMLDLKIPAPQDVRDFLILRGPAEALAWEPSWRHGVSAVFTSPRYNAGIRYEACRDHTPSQVFYEEGRALARFLDYVLCPGGQALINVAPVMEDAKEMLCWIALGLLHVPEGEQRPLWEVENWFTWAKSGTTPGPQGEHSWGHFAPSAHAHRVHQTWEWVLQLKRTREAPRDLDKLAIGTPYVDKSNLKRYGHTRDLRCRGNLWAIPYRTKTKKSPHPAQFPLELPEWGLALLGLGKDDLVLDPFGGVGNTGLACAKLGLRFTGVDLGLGYCREATKNLTEVYRASP